MGDHNAILQRLDVSHINDEIETFYNVDSFRNTDAWKDAPVFLALKSMVSTENIRHLTREEVLSGNYPKDEFRLVGRVNSANIPDGGEPKLLGNITIDDPETDTMAVNGEISLSTGIISGVTPTNTGRTTSGEALPYHVLLFKRNGCLNCSPNDKGAMLLNCESPHLEVKMSDVEEPKTEGLLKQIIAKLDNLGKKTHEPEEVKPMEKEIITKDLSVELGNITTERDALKSQIGELIAEKEQARKDSEWGLLLNALPAAWKEKEAETRAEFESNPAAFAVKLVTFTNTIPPVQKAIGNTACGCDNSEEMMLKSIAETEKTTGYKIQ